MVRRAAIVCFASIAVSVAQAGFLFPSRPQFELVTDQRYGVSESEKADVDQLPGAKHPAMLMVHGGGWHSGDKAGYIYYAKMLAAKGIVAVAISYRL